MNWGERVQKIVQTIEHDPDTTYGLDYADGYADGGHHMARWQRAALLSEKSVERAARALHDRFGSDPEATWQDWADEARVALAAATGDEA